MRQMDRIIEQRAALTASNARFGDILARLRLQHDNEGTETIATNGEELVYNVEWLATLDDETLRYTLAFVALLVAYDFRSRQGDRDASRWSFAYNYAANAELSKIKGLTRPAGALYEPAYAGMIADEIYADLAQRSHTLDGLPLDPEPSLDGIVPC